MRENMVSNTVLLRALRVALLLLLFTRISTAVSDDIEAYACKENAGTFKLGLDCAPGIDGQPLLIEIQWNDTFFGESYVSCGPNKCCPDNPHCIVPVTETDHADHWQKLDDCNGQETCRVNAVHVRDARCDDGETDYEVVTYRCVPQEFVEEGCYASATYLQPDCRDKGEDVTVERVIDIDWGATFFGVSSCLDSPPCCPEKDDCYVLVINSSHYGGQHWDELTNCNGQRSCTVSVERIGPGHGCDSNTDYETITYRCIPTKTELSTGSSVSTSTIDSISSKAGDSTLSPTDTTTGHLTTDEAHNSVVVSTGSPLVVSTTLEEPDDGSDSTNAALIAVSVLVVLLLAVTTIVGYLCYNNC